MSLEAASLSSVVPVNSMTSVSFMALGLIPWVGEVFVQGDEGPVSGVAQGVQDHGVAGVRHEETGKGGR